MVIQRNSQRYAFAAGVGMDVDQLGLIEGGQGGGDDAGPSQPRIPHSKPAERGKYTIPERTASGSYNALAALCDSYTGVNRLLLRDRPSMVDVAV